MVVIKIDGAYETTVGNLLNHEKAQMFMEMLSSSDFVGMNEQSPFRLLTNACAKAKGAGETQAQITKALYDQVLAIKGTKLNLVAA